MRRFKEEFREWSKGAIVADTTADKVPKNAASRARNVAWLKAGFPAKRKGCPILTPSAQSGRNPILALGHGLGLNWVIDDAGRWSKVNGDGTFSPIDAGNATPFTAGTHYPVVNAAKDHLFVCNGVDRKKTNGTVVTNWGFDAPAAPTVGIDAAVGNPNGTYLIALTAYNSATGHESSLSANTSVSPASKKIDVSWTFPTDPQITHVRVHIFKVGLTNQFLRLGSVDVSPAPDPTTGGYTSLTTSIVVNVTDTDITNLTVLSPTTTENNRPPANITFCAYHAGRMFVTDGTFLYFSKIGDPESFDPANFERQLNQGDDQKIVGFLDTSDYQLVVWKSEATYALQGPSDPNVWNVTMLDPSVGLSSVRAIAYTEGAVWWEALQGLFRIEYSGATGTVGKPKRMEFPWISDRLESVNEALIGGSVAAYDAVRQRLFFVVPDQSSSGRNTIMLPYNQKLNVFEDTWDPMDVSALGTFFINGVPVVVIGGYQGRIFRMWDTPYVDGVRMTDGVSTTFTLAGTVTASTVTSLTDSTATFDVAADGLREIPVVAVSPSGLVQRNIIQSNTGTVLTLQNNWGVTPDVGWNYYIGNPWFEFDTAHVEPTSNPESEGSAFYSRNFKRVLVRATSDAGASLDVYPIIDGDFSSFPTHTSMKILSGGAKWDIDKWDMGRFGAGAVTTVHQGLGVRGKSCGIRIQSRTPGDAVILLSIGLYGTEHGHKV